MSVDIIQAEAQRGDYLMHPDTLKDFKGRWRPRVSDWNDYDTWQKSGGLDAAQRAANQCREILKQAPERMVDAETDSDLVRFVSSVKSVKV